MDPNLFRHVIAASLFMAAIICGSVSYRKQSNFWREMNRPGGRADAAGLEKAQFFKLLAGALVFIAAFFAWPEGLSFR